ncbi:hypothetical protein ASE69_11230 [Sphingomonas sp. Leaf208]|nr:hypothetical protein ASE69_11230 [Sphingomonas sp. Leaf208]
MSNLARLDDRRQIAAQPVTPSLPPSIASTLADNRFRSTPWNAADAMFSIVSTDERRQVADGARAYRASLAPCPRDWLKKRLSSMALAHGHEKDPDRVTAWLQETGRLLLDLPHDILAYSIDEAIKRSERGFMPAVGQTRAIADPLVATRREEAYRLEAMVQVMEGRTRGDADAKPWERVVAAVAPEADRIPAADIAAFNRNMRKFGTAMRARADGSTYSMGPGDREPDEQGTSNA